jgi:hypothetical protein
VAERKSVARPRGTTPAKRAAKPAVASSATKGPARTATYVYCVLRGAGSASARGAPAGPPGLGPVQLLDAGDGLALAVADAPLPAYGAPAIEAGLKDIPWVAARAMGHERVVEHLAQTSTAVPMKLFTLFASGARAVADVRRRAASVHAAMDRIEGCREWGVRIALDELRARRAAARARTDAPPASGTSFLLAKKREADAARTVVADALQDAEDLYAALARRAREVQRRTVGAPAAGARVLVDAVFLVPARAQRAFVAAVDAEARARGARGVEVTLTGPWPPYHFVGTTA